MSFGTCVSMSSLCQHIRVSVMSVCQYASVFSPDVGVGGVVREGPGSKDRDAVRQCVGLPLPCQYVRVLVSHRILSRQKG